MNAKKLIEDLRHNRSAVSYMLKVQLSFANIRYTDSEVQDVINAIERPS